MKIVRNFGIKNPILIGLLCFNLLLRSVQPAHANEVFGAYGLEGIKVERVNSQIEDERAGFYLAAVSVALGSVLGQMAWLHTRPEPVRVLPYEIEQQPVPPNLFGLSRQHQLATMYAAHVNAIAAERAAQGSLVNRGLTTGNAFASTFSAFANARQALDNNRTVGQRIGAGARSASALLAAGVTASRNPETRLYGPLIHATGGVAKIGSMIAVDLRAVDIRDGNGTATILRNCVADSLCTAAGMVAAHVGTRPRPVGPFARGCGLLLSTACSVWANQVVTPGTPYRR